MRIASSVPLLLRNGDPTHLQPRNPATPRRDIGDQLEKYCDDFTISSLSLSERQETSLSTDDTDQVQQGSHPVLETFILFPNLPLEFRFKIWNWTFRRDREVNIGDVTLFKNMPEVEANLKASYEAPDPLPVTSHVNKESREEILKHHIVIRHDGYDYLTGKTNVCRPFCVNVELDLPWITPVALLSEYSNEWFSLLAPQAPELFERIHSLEIRDCYVEWPSKRLLRRRIDVQHLQRSIFPTFKFILVPEKLDEGLRPLSRFTGLQALTVVQSTSSAPSSRPQLDQKNSILNFFILYKAILERGAPVLIVKELEL